MGLKELLEDAGFSEASNSEYFDSIIDKSKCNYRYVKEVSKGYHVERGIPVPDARDYLIFTAKNEEKESYFLYEDVSLGKIMDLFNSKSTIQKEGIKPEFTGEEAYNKIVLIKNERDARRQELTGPKI